jgi:uncharacterized membrane protein
MTRARELLKLVATVAVFVTIMPLLLLTIWVLASAADAFAKRG